MDRVPYLDSTANGTAVAAPAPPARILIVDDEPDVEALIRQRFKRRNTEYDFVFARNGREALERLTADPAIDLVVTDINMPVMDGLALLSQINALDRRVIKAVILSAYGDMENIRTAMNRGAFDFLTKPIDFQDFETTLRRTRDALAATRDGLTAREQLAAIEQELDVAARIQGSILPREFFPDRGDFSVYAEMTAARGVGGDFYDFFLIDDRRLGFLIGDVSGKGIPAALLMAVSRTLLRATALRGTAPDECLRYANQVLDGQPGSSVFVTVFYGILHTDTGELQFGIGGHNPPYRVSAAGALETIAEPGGPVVGLLPQVKYETGRLQLAPGDSIFLFTDGVTEAMNSDEKFFGEGRLREALRAVAGESPEQMVKTVAETVAAFEAGAAQNDDLTMLAVKWTGP